MKQNKTIAMLGFISCALLMNASAQAQSLYQDNKTKQWSTSSWYIGAGIGQSRTSIDDQRLIRSLMDNGASSVQFSMDERDTAYKLYLGKQLNENFALEGGYFNLGKSNFSALTNPGAGSLNGEVGFQGVNLDLLGRVHFTERFSMLANIGMHYTEAKAHFSGNRLYAITNPNPTERKLNGKVGLGLEYQMTQALALRGQVERYRVNDGVQNRGDVDFYSIGLVYKLGQPAPERSIPYVAPTPAPMPEPLVITETRPAAVVVAAPVPVSEKINFSAEALFDFDQSIVKQDGKNALDQMLDSLKNMNTEVMVTVGHTDSIGNDEYNQALSIRRAEAVKAYLISRGIAADRVYTEGKGEAQPIADNTSNEGRAKNRRVIVEVVGSRR